MNEWNEIAAGLVVGGKRNATPFDTFPEEEQDLLVEKMNKDLREPDRNIVVRFLRKLTAAELGTHLEIVKRQAAGLE